MSKFNKNEEKKQELKDRTKRLLTLAYVICYPIILLIAMKELILSGKVAIVTGASRGIGREIALKLGENGANIVVNSTEKSIPQAEKVKSQIESFKQKAIVFTGDVSQEQTAIDIVKKTVDEFGRVDILVNNVGTKKDKLLIKMSLDEWNDVLQTNLTSAFLMTREALKQMLKLKIQGSIINISSIVGQIGNPGQANYGASKSGLENLAKCVALEMGPRGIRANNVALGFVDTQLTSDVNKEQRDAIVNLSCLKRLITTNEVAETVLFLASSGSSAITGQTINVDGGAVRR